MTASASDQHYYVQQQQQQQHYANASSIPGGGPQVPQQQQQPQPQQPPHNQYYAQQQLQQQQNAHYVQHPHQDPHHQQQQQQQVVGIYNTAQPPSKKSQKPGRGAAIINSMRNLSLGTAISRASPKNNSNQNNISNSNSNLKSSVNDWETRWDDDEDDSEGEEDQKPSPANNTLPLQLRPGMDNFAATPTKLPDLQYNHQHPQHPQKAHLVTATPEDQRKNQQQLLQQPQLHVPVSDADDGVEWDSGAMQGAGDPHEKPNVQMFLPLLRVLGKGSFGKVVLVQKRVGKERGALFAMKILRKSHLVKRRQIERTRTERKVLSVVNHPFIMKLHYAFQSPDKLYLVLDYCPGGELFFHLSRFRRFPERVARFYAAELLLALGHLHKRGIIYRDLKPENVLLDADGHVKLGDFGLAKAGIKHACEGATSMCGTPEYMAPEVLAQQGHGFCVDYWGLGMLVYEMMTGLPPWYTTDRAKLFRRLRSAPLDIPSYFSQASAGCVSALLERNPRRRLGVTGIRAAMENEFFRSISWRALYGKRVEAPIRPCEGWNAPEPNEEGGGATALPTTPAPLNNNIENLNSNDLDAATANFDNTFTRMPVETDDGNIEDNTEGLEELHEDTFVGFTFDEKDREEIAAVQASRQRTHNNYAVAGTTNEDDQYQTRQID